MKDKPKVGHIGELQFTIEEKHAIDFSGDDMPAILSTPWLIWFMEHSARETMLPLLDLEESTVGVVINIEHLAATPVGA